MLQKWVTEGANVGAKIPDPVDYKYEKKVIPY